MPTRDTAPVGAPCWIDLLSSDTAASAAFYGELFGWTVEEGGEDYGGYANFIHAGAPVAGMMAKGPMTGDSPDGWSVYLCTRDAEVTAKAIEAAGGSLAFPPMEVPALGIMSVAVDPGGAHIGLWQPAPFEGFTTLAEPGTPGWFELHTPVYEPTVTFYRDAFGWDAHTMSDAPEFRYTTLFGGEEAAAGIMDAAGMRPTGAPGHWSIYFQVESADAALERTVELGGAVSMPAEDTPYGRLAVATDPLGVAFKLVS